MFVSDSANKCLQVPCFASSSRYILAWFWWKGLRFLFGNIAGLFASEQDEKYLEYRHAGRK
jgi:hypothetical protein